MTQDIYAADFKNRPYWWEAVDLQNLAEEPDALPAKVEVAVIGGGYTGLSAALVLARAGRQVAVLDAGHPGYGCSARNGGLLGPSFHKLGLTGLSRAYGEERAAAILHESLETMESLKLFIKEEEIECGWHEAGRFKGANAPGDYEVIARDIDKLGKVLDLRAEMVPKVDQRGQIGSDHYHGGAIFHRDGHLHPGLLAEAIAKRVKDAGGRLFAHAEVTGCRAADGGFELQTDARVIKADQVLVCTNGYTTKAFPALRRRVIPIRSAIIATEELPEETAKSLSPLNRGFGESSRLFYYYRPSPDGKRMIFGGRTVHFDDRYRSYCPDLYAGMTRIFPQLKGCKLTHGWSGTVAYTFDHAPHIGQSEGLWFAMGYCGSGVGRATYFGRKLGYKVLGDPKGATAIDDLVFSTRPFYTGHPWFLPAVIRWNQLKDRLQR